MPIYLDGNAHEPEADVTRKNSQTGATEAAAGFTGLRVRISDTDNGAALNAALDVAVSERTNTAGRFHGTIDGGDINTYLAAYLDKDVYEIWYDGAGTIFAAQKQRVLRRRL